MGLSRAAYQVEQGGLAASRGPHKGQKRPDVNSKAHPLHRLHFDRTRGDVAPRYLFFAGKGGVGKTSIACAAAVTLAERHQRVLLVSTDPASNLADVLGFPLASAPTAVAAVPGFFARNIDPQATAAAYREHILGLYREVLPAVELAGLEEQLAGACIVEIAAFDPFDAS